MWRGPGGAVRLQAFTEQGCYGAVALEAERAHVGEIALAAAFRYRDDVVRVPERFPALFRESPFPEKFSPRHVVQAAHFFSKLSGIDSASGADAGVTLENLFAEITGIGAQLPLMNAGV